MFFPFMVVMLKKIYTSLAPGADTVIKQVFILVSHSQPRDYHPSWPWKQ